MRLRARDGSIVHLAYGTNVHPAEDVEGLLTQLRTYGAGVRAALGADRLGLGLWLPAQAARVLASDAAVAHQVKQALERHGLEVVTINAFPYERFHAPVVKRAVYKPDWFDPARLDYTVDCARALTRLLPDDAARGSISTLPLGWRSPWSADRQKVAREHLDRLGDELAKLASETGRTVRVGLEPEPGCVVETTADAVERLAGIDAEHLGICLDTCHLATAFEDAASAVTALTGAGLPIVKAQPAAALHVADPASPAARSALADFAEDRFLHQVREQHGGNRLLERDDLPDALEGSRPLPGRSPWRVHFHVPVHAELQRPLQSTRGELAAALAVLVGGDAPVTDHLEVETYTWSVLPPDQRPANDSELIAGLAAELGWVRDRLTELGLGVA
ncbi:MAG TPA: metabolite traffic protein EboE [Jiangellaceae bacterium]|nr:metabolite traffic protein EboE [Jiangellaceae bacterium]